MSLSTAVYRFLLVCLGVALLSPLLVFTESLTFPFVTSKVFVFRSAVLLAGVAMGYLLLRHRELGFRLDRIGKALLLLSGVFFLSGFLGVDFYHSWYSGHERMGGIFSFLHYVLLFFVLQFAVRGWEETEVAGITFIGWQSVLRATWGVSVMLAVVAILQRLSDSPILFVQPGGRVYSALGNPIYLGNAMAISIFLSLYLFFREQYRWWYVPGAMLMVGALLYSESRGALFGLGVGGLVAMAWLFYHSGAQAKKYVSGFVACGVVCGSLLFIPSVQEHLKSTSVGRIFNFHNDISPRIIAWGIAVDAVRDRPLLGYGYDTFHHVFNQNFDARSTEYSFYETWFDNAHNNVLNLLATTGLIGFFAYGYFYVAVVRGIAHRQKRGDVTLLGAAMVLGMFAVDFFAKVFVFDHHTSLLFIMIFAAHLTDFVPAVVTVRYTKFYFVTGSIVVMGYGLLYVNVVAMTTNARSIDMLREKYVNPDSVVLYADELLRRATPYHKDVVLDVSRHVQEVYPRLTISEDRKERLVQTVADELERVSHRHPRELQPYLERAALISLLPPTDERYDTLMQLYARLRELSPQRQQIFYVQTKTQLQYGKEAEAMRTLEEAIAINPRVMYSFAFRSYVKASLGDPTSLTDLLHALDNGFVPSNYEEMSRVAAQLRAADLSAVIVSHPIVHRLYPTHKITPTDEDLELLAYDYEKIGLYSGAAMVRGMKSKPEVAKKYPQDSYEPILAMIAQYKKMSGKVPNTLVMLLVIMGAPEKVVADATVAAQRPDLLEKSIEGTKMCEVGKPPYERFRLCAW